MARYLYSELSTLLTARENCAKKPDHAWFDRHTDMIESLVKDHLPSGSGYDAGTTLDLDESHGDKLVFNTSYHHMDEWGGYDGWTEHTVTVKPALSNDFHLRISGRNRGGIKEMMYDDFRQSLMTDVEWDIMCTWPKVAEMGLEIKHVWIDQCTGHMLVTRNGETLFNGSEAYKLKSHYSGSPIELCKAFCVQYAKQTN